METTDQKVSQVRRQNPLTFYLRTLLYMFMALVMRVVAWLPLGALLLFPEGSYLRWLAVLCPVLLLFFILPLRFSFADALTQRSGERRFSFDTATSVRNYGEKLAESLLHALRVFLWGVPLWLMMAAGYYFYNQTDAISLMKGIGNLGAGVSTGLCAVANFFRGIFGGEALVPKGGIMEGLYVIVAIFALGALILLWGVVRNSAYRYIWAKATRQDKNPHAEARRRLRGRRWKQFWVGIVNLVLWAPALFVLFTTFQEVLKRVSNALFTFVSTQSLSMPELSQAAVPLMFAFLVCYMPLLPVRRILTCAFATHRLHAAAPEPAEAPVAVVTTASGAPMPAEAATSAIQPAPEAVYPYAEDTAEPEAAETPVPAPVAAYQPYHSEPEPIQPTQPAPEPEVETKPLPANEPVAETKPAQETQPLTEPTPDYAAAAMPEFEPDPMPKDNVPVAEQTIADKPETPADPLQEDAYTQAYHPENTVAAEDEPDTSEEPVGAKYPREEGMDI